MTADQTPAPTVEIDCRGLLCPAPIIELARRIGEVALGDMLAVVADDVAARYDVPAWCRMKAQEYAGEDLAADGVPRYLVVRRS